LTTGDVKYHLGYSADLKTSAGSTHVSMLFNPSHLDYIDPVLLGSVRGRQDRYANGMPKSQYALSVMIHGDASFSSQGVIAEMLTMSQPPAYTVGGTIHVVTNNQIGYTTSNPTDARSSRYCTGIAKAIEAPIVHVNADDAESVIRAIDFAYAYRQQFFKDVVIDIVGYRRHGHQEVDEPRATQPIEYKIIKNHPRPCDVYAQQLISERVITESDYQAMVKSYREILDCGGSVKEVLSEGIKNKHAEFWRPYLNQDWQTPADTTITKEQVSFLSERILAYPEHFKLLKQIDKMMNQRRKMAEGEIEMDWGFAETMAYASIIDKDIPVRFSGEDSRRGTFFHRHATLYDQETGSQHMPLLHIRENQAHFELYDSILAELGPMGFEYGYSTSRPATLVVWEAQFGDFANSAQVIIDQFISSAWNKWQRLSGLVLLLPHGYEGMGPEHSSARLERYLQLCAQDNMQVCVPTTPAQMFHLLNRQVLRKFRRPLIVMTPKSLLRHKLATSPISDLSEGEFHLVIPELDAKEIKPKEVKRVVLCCGKVYYDLLAKRRENKQKDVAILRVEQLYPFPYDVLKEALSVYKHVKQVFWCQEEPRNQGAWFISHDRLLKSLVPDCELYLSSRPAMAAPAAGYPALNKQQQIDLVDLALDVSRLPEK
jgi:2-oxoglutarate dehydrogenase E1 component